MPRAVDWLHDWVGRAGLSIGRVKHEAVVDGTVAAPTRVHAGFVSTATGNENDRRFRNSLLLSTLLWPDNGMKSCDPLLFMVSMFGQYLWL